MKETTLGYLKYEDRWLLLYRNKKEKDLNEGKWIGIGGKFLPGEHADECFLRELKEETGFSPVSYKRVGTIHFRSDIWEDEEMALYCGELSAKDFEAPLPDCDEGELAWIPREDIMKLPMWEGDRLFLPAVLDGEDDIEMTLVYKGDSLVKSFKGGIDI